MDLERLRIFLAIVDAGSMSTAAGVVHLTQPTLSRSLRLLEEELGVPLFERAGRRLLLTSAGRALVSRARELVRRAEEVARQVTRSARREYFDVRLGVLESVATYLLPHALDEVRAAFPELGVKLTVARTPLLVERLHADELDLAVTAQSGSRGDLHAQRVGAYVLSHYGRRDRFPELSRARTVADLARFPIVEIEPAPGQPRYSTPDAHTFALTTTVASVKALILAGFGVGDLVDFTLSPAERRRLVRARIPHDPSCALFVVAGPTFGGQAGRRIAGVLTTALAAALAARRGAPVGRTRSVRRSSRAAAASGVPAP